MSLGYEREKLGQAVDLLATSAAPIQKRLEYAFTAMATLVAHKLSKPERQDAFNRIYEKLTADKSDEHRGYVPTTTTALSDEAASIIATEIVELEAALRRDQVDELEARLRR